MRIAIVFDCMYPHTTGGGEKQYVEFAREFVQLGHQVDYLTRRQWEGADPVDDGVRAVAITGGFPLYDDAGVRRPIGALKFSLALFAHLVRHRSSYDVVMVSATPVLNVFAGRAALAGTRTRLVVDWLEIWTRRQWLEYSGPVVGRVADVLQHLAVRLSPLATGHSQHTEDGARRNGLPAARFLRSPGIIPRQPTEVVPRLEVGDAPGPVLFVGRHIQDKRPQAIPPALKIARRTVPGLTAIIGGRGPESEAVRVAIAEAGLDDAISMPGFVDEDELARLMGKASMLLNPSRREGYGLVVVEAAAHGTPSVVVDDPTNAATELVIDGVNGFKASSATADDLAAAMLRVIEGGADLRRSTRAWYEDAISSKSIAATVRRLAEHLEG